mmetsp:Transcript_4282/g.11456  ORF Transcript_4282/g.11456 Transcript_4282/m.11456 type:complete len:412 (-) Transcript_4282:446-1681(-)
MAPGGRKRPNTARPVFVTARACLAISWTIAGLHRSQRVSPRRREASDGTLGHGHLGRVGSLVILQLVEITIGTLVVTARYAAIDHGIHRHLLVAHRASVDGRRGHTGLQLVALRTGDHRLVCVLWRTAGKPRTRSPLFLLRFHSRTECLRGPFAGLPLTRERLLGLLQLPGPCLCLAGLGHLCLLVRRLLLGLDPLLFGLLARLLLPPRLLLRLGLGLRLILSGRQRLRGLLCPCGPGRGLLLRPRLGLRARRLRRARPGLRLRRRGARGALGAVLRILPRTLLLGLFLLQLLRLLCRALVLSLLLLLELDLLDLLLQALLQLKSLLHVRTAVRDVDGLLGALQGQLPQMLCLLRQRERGVPPREVRDRGHGQLRVLLCRGGVRSYDLAGPHREEVAREPCLPAGRGVLAA